MSEPEEQATTIRVGNTTFQVVSHFEGQDRQTIDKKLIKLMKQEVEKMVLKLDPT